MPKKPRSKSPPSSDGPSLGPWGRLAVTLLAPVALTILARFGPTVVDTSALPPAQRWSGNFSVFALGIMPFITASCVVEYAAAIVPRWAPLRHGGPEGRRKLWRATMLCALVLSLYQASSIARLAESLSLEPRPGLASTLMIDLTLTAGAFLLCFLVQLIGAYGLSGGFGLLMVTWQILPMAVSMIEGRAPGADGKPLSPLNFAVLSLLAAAAVAVTWYTLRPRTAGPAAEPREHAYRAPPAPEEATPIEIPVPASGTSPLIIATSLLAFPATLVNLRLPMGGVVTALHNNTVYSAAGLVLIAALAAGFSWVFNQPSRIAALRGGGRATADLEAEARAELLPAMARTLLFCVVLFGIDQIAGELTGSWLDATSFALVTAVALDIKGELRARLAMPDLVPIWPEHRPYAVAVAQGALRAAGIAVHARDERLRRMFQFFGPFVPIALLVRRADAKRAAKVLSQVLSPEGKGEKSELAGARPRPAARRETRVFAAISLAVIGLIVARPWSRPPPPQKPRAHAGARALEITLVDDDNDVFEAPPGPLPKGILLQVENAPVGPGRTAPRHYARIVPVSGESLEQARARLAAWVEHLAVPAGEHVALERVSEFDEDQERFEIVGWRTYLLKGPAAVTGADVADAFAAPDTSSDPGRPGGAHVAVTLNAAGAERFAELTRANVKRRLAIVVDGTVESAPLILSEIRGGHVQITMGEGDPEEKLAEAKQLARALLGE